MRAVVTRVWRTGFLLALLAPTMAADAQVAIQVKNGTVWGSTIERAVAPITFRWRWDGAETPTGVGWQVATVTPTSTATTRTQDVIAGETQMRLPATSGVKGGYEEFTVNPASAWPSTFYIRVRVNTGRTSVYSRWITVSTLERAADGVNLRCALAGWHQDVDAYYMWGRPKPIVPGSKVSVGPEDHVWVHALVMNTGRTVAKYKRRFRIDHKKQVLIEGTVSGDMEASVGENVVRTIAPGKTDTITVGATANRERLLRESGNWDVYMYVTPIDRPPFTCSFGFAVW